MGSWSSSSNSDRSKTWTKFWPKWTRSDGFLVGLPNLPADDVRAGGKENNQVERTSGEKPVFSFEPQHHVDIAERLGIIDYARGAKLSGYGFWIYKGDGSRLEWALLNYFVETHLNDGYEMLFVPHILNETSGYTAGQYPKFKEDVFWLEAPEGTLEKNRQFILPTQDCSGQSLSRRNCRGEGPAFPLLCLHALLPQGSRQSPRGRTRYDSRPPV